jgi:hypothetical protein
VNRVGNRRSLNGLAIPALREDRAADQIAIAFASVALREGDWIDALPREVRSLRVPSHADNRVTEFGPAATDGNLVLFWSLKRSRLIRSLAGSSLSEQAWRERCVAGRQELTD